MSSSGPRFIFQKEPSAKNLLEDLFKPNSSWFEHPARLSFSSTRAFSARPRGLLIAEHYKLGSPHALHIPRVGCPLSNLQYFNT